MAKWGVNKICLLKSASEEKDRRWQHCSVHQRMSQHIPSDLLTDQLRCLSACCEVSQWGTVSHRAMTANSLTHSEFPHDRWERCPPAWWGIQQIPADVLITFRDAKSLFIININKHIFLMLVDKSMVPVKNNTSSSSDVNAFTRCSQNLFWSWGPWGQVHWHYTFFLPKPTQAGGKILFSYHTPKKIESLILHFQDNRNF